ncbi:hypothetical protein [Sinomonas atrocyanea]
MGAVRRRGMTRGWGSAVLAVAAALALMGCTTAADVRAAPGIGQGGNSAAPTRPHPGSTAEHALYNLTTDLFFVSLPPGSTRTAQKCTPSPSDPRGGGDCTVTFTSDLAPQAVFDDFARRAGLTGWTAEQKDRDGRTVSWAMAYRDGSHARVVLSPLDPEKGSPPYAYKLAASI